MKEYTLSFRSEKIFCKSMRSSWEIPPVDSWKKMNKDEIVKELQKNQLINWYNDDRERTER